MQYWLMKSEPDECSIDDALAAPGRLTPWTGVRNYQADYTNRHAPPGLPGGAEALCWMSGNTFRTAPTFLTLRRN